MVKQILFYATEGDLREGLERVERVGDIKYAVTGLFDSSEPMIFNSHTEIANLGISLDGQFVNLVTYIILFRDELVTSRAVPQRKGGVKYAVDGRSITPSITFTPSGVYDDKCILYGTLTGVDASNEKSYELYKLFERNFFKGYKKVKSFKVSQEALKKLDYGMRLTRNYKADPSMDLSR